MLNIACFLSLIGFHTGETAKMADFGEVQSYYKKCL